MLNSKIPILVVFSTVSFGVVAKVPQMNSDQLATYATQMQMNYGRQNVTSKPQAYLTTPSYSDNKLSGYRTISYSGSNEGRNSTLSNLNIDQNSQSIMQPSVNTNWVVEYVTGKEIANSNGSTDLSNLNIKNNSHVNESTRNYSAGRKATLSCVIQAARSEGVPLYVLLGIQSKERGQNGEMNASNDMGHFQVNTQHFKANGMFSNVNIDLARTDGCLNALLAAKVLKTRLNAKNVSSDFWVRAAAYHSWTPQFNAAYRNGTSKVKGLIAYSMQWKTWLERNGINPN